MSKVAHTAGHWKWHWRHENGEANGSVFAEPREGHAYAVAICPRYQTKEQWEADATLLSAAPDMLADHQENARLLSLVIQDLQGRVEGGKLAALAQCLDRSRASISAAEGRAP